MAEADDWKTIEGWRMLHSHEVSISSCGEWDEWRLTLIDWGPKIEQRGGPFEGKRTTVLEQGAQWCREHDERCRVENVERYMERLSPAHEFHESPLDDPPSSTRTPE